MRKNESDLTKLQCMIHCELGSTAVTSVPDPQFLHSKSNMEVVLELVGQKRFAIEYVRDNNQDHSYQYGLLKTILIQGLCSIFDLNDHPLLTPNSVLDYP